MGSGLHGPEGLPLASLGDRKHYRSVAVAQCYTILETGQFFRDMRQDVDGHVLLDWPVPCVRLWEQDATAVLASGNLGLAILSPLMVNASVPLVEQVIATVLSAVALPQQADLLSILGIFAEPLIDHQRFVRIIGKEKLMASDLITYLMEEKLAELEAEKQSAIAAVEAKLEAEKQSAIAAEKAAVLRQFQDAFEQMVRTRFPDAPPTIGQQIQRVTAPQQLQELLITAIRVADLPAFEQALTAAVAAD